MRITDVIRPIYRVVNPRKLCETFLHALYRATGWPEFRYYCPTCERPLRYWRRNRRDIGLERQIEERDGRICPICYSFERTRLFALYLDQHHLLTPGLRFLHFAPEHGLERRLRKNLGITYRTADLFMKNVDHQEDITRMTFANSSFDFIYCSNVLEHVLDDRSAMSELFRVLAPGGRLVIQVPIRGDTTYENPAIVSPAERAAHFGQADHVRFYGRDIRVRLEDAGFYVEECYLQEKLAISSMQMARMNVGVRELLHLCSKRQSNGSAVAWPAASQSNVS